MSTWICRGLCHLQLVSISQRRLRAIARSELYSWNRTIQSRMWSPTTMLAMWDHSEKKLFRRGCWNWMISPKLYMILRLNRKRIDNCIGRPQMKRLRMRRLRVPEILRSWPSCRPHRAWCTFKAKVAIGLPISPNRKVRWKSILTSNCRASNLSWRPTRLQEARPDHQVPMLVQDHRVWSEGIIYSLLSCNNRTKTDWKNHILALRMDQSYKMWEIVEISYLQIIQMSKVWAISINSRVPVPHRLPLSNHLKVCYQEHEKSCLLRISIWHLR